jgi:hypothetical protein
MLRPLRISGHAILPDPPVRVPRSVSRGRAEPDGDVMPPSEDGRVLTEAEYRAWLQGAMREHARVLNERFAAILPDDVRFGWAAASEPPAG